MRKGSENTGWIRGLHTSAIVTIAWFALSGIARAEAVSAGQQFHKTIQPLLSNYCFDCHADGTNKGKVAFDEFKSDQDLLANTELWWKVLKNVRAGLMPPAKHPQPTEAEKQVLANWIKYGPFGLDPAHPDPGRVTLRRLNRVEYRNTIRDLMGVDFNTTEEFPPDDTGYGFDTIGDVLNVSPMLLEKYMQAAEKIVQQAVPDTARTVAQTSLYGYDFKSDDHSVRGSKLSYYKEASVTARFQPKNPGKYHLRLNLIIRGTFDFDPGECNAALLVDGVEQWHDHLKWQNGARIPIEFDRDWQPGEHTFTLTVHPLKEKPANAPVGQCSGLPTTVDLQIDTLNIQGPMERKYWAKTPNFDRFFLSEEPPADASARRAWERQTIGAFARKAFRRPADDRVLDRLVAIWEATSNEPGKTFIDGAKEAMVAVLSSPRFVFRIEKIQPGSDGPTPLLDEYSLASRLSYFLWSTMPDAELTALADKGQLRAHLAEQVKRMLKDPRSQELVSNFTGQWLELRDVEGININVGRVLRQDNQPLLKPGEVPSPEDFASRRKRFSFGGMTSDNPLFKLFGKNFTISGSLRVALRAEPEMLFAEVMRNDESVATLLDTDHTYLNEKLATLYNIPGITGSEMRRVDLPKDSPRGGLITMGSVLIVTSNPTRTSPVKRGQFILDNIIGMPTPPPPAEVPALEASEKNSTQRLSFRQVLEIHRNTPMCASCHARLDPMGLSLENFNALGMWREKERGLPIDSTGKLMTGEPFKDARDVKRILLDHHKTDFYRCLTEKMMTYALGRGIEYYDTETVDQIVDRMQREDGRFSALLNGIVESAAFQRRRAATDRIADSAKDVPANPQTGRNPLN